MKLEMGNFDPLSNFLYSYILEWEGRNNDNFCLKTPRCPSSNSCQCLYWPWKFQKKKAEHVERRTEVEVSYCMYVTNGRQVCLILEFRSGIIVTRMHISELIRVKNEALFFLSEASLTWLIILTRRTGFAN